MCFITVELHIIHYITFAKITCRIVGILIIPVVQKIKLIASVVVEKNMFLDLHLYEHLKLGRLWNNSIVFFMNREGEKYKLVLYNLNV